MLLENYLKEKKISLYKLADLSGVSYTTIFNIVHGKADIEKCSVGNVLRIANALKLSVEDLIFLCDSKYSFTVFKSEQCHLVHRLGEVEYILDILLFMSLPLLFIRLSLLFCDFISCHVQNRDQIFDDARVHMPQSI